MKFLFENKTWLIDPSNPPLYALAIKQIDGHHSSDMRDVAFRYADFIAANLKHIYLPDDFNDVLSAKIVCQASKILTPHFQLSSNNLHCYRLQGIDLVNQIANILSVSVKESTNCELKLIDGVINLTRHATGIQVVNKALKCQVNSQQSVESKCKLFEKLRVHDNIASKYCPPLFIFNFLAKQKLQINVPLSLNFTSKLPIIYKEISHTRPTSQQSLIDCISLLAKKELLKNTFSKFKSTKLIIQNTVSETKAIPPLFYVFLSKCGESSKVGFQESITTKRPFQGRKANVAVFLLNDTNQAGIYFESAIKISLSNLGIRSVKRNSDHYNCNYNFLLMAIFNIINNDPSLSNFVKEIHLTNSFQIQRYLPLHNEFQSLQRPPEHLLSEAVSNRAEINIPNSKIDRSTLDLLINLVKANSSKFGLKVIVQKEP